jgi:dTDP-4-dehydrorhamnose 3,5-epimerase
MSRFTVINTALPGLYVLERQAISDVRGSFCRMFCADELKVVGWTTPIAQVNFACTYGQGTVRGLHYQQQPYAEMKLVSCLRGEVWDVAVDLRPASPTYMHWHAEHLSSGNYRSMLIPQGYAHGVQVLGEGAELLYCHSTPYVSGVDSGLNPLDPDLEIAWPLPVINLSDKDRMRPMLRALGADFRGVLCEV